MKKYWFLFLFPVFLFSCNSVANEKHIEEIQEETKESTEIKEDEIKIIYVEVTFLDYDDTLLYKGTIEKGKSITYPKDEPKREADDVYEYVFTGWDKSLENIVEDTTFRALYEQKDLGFGNITWIG